MKYIFKIPVPWQYFRIIASFLDIVGQEYDTAVMDQPWIFGIDGGGTSTRIQVESLEGTVLWYRENSSINPRSVGWSGAEQVLKELFTALYRETGLKPGGCAGGFAGVAGIGRTDDCEQFTNILRRASGLSCPLQADNDAIIALAGAFEKKSGVLLICGTGSIAVSANSEGVMFRAGGWGHILGDEGSAWDVGRRGLAVASRSADNRAEKTVLLGYALEYFHIQDAYDLISAVYENFNKAQVAGFARLVAQARDEQDPAACAIFASAITELELLVRTTAAHLHSSRDNHQIAFRGGFIENDGWLAEHLSQALTASLPDFKIIAPRHEPVAGACILARQL